LHWTALLLFNNDQPEIQSAFIATSRCSLIPMSRTVQLAEVEVGAKISDHYDSTALVRSLLVIRCFGVMFSGTGTCGNLPPG